MIESLIIDRLWEDPDITEFVGEKIFITFAPDGTETPYITLEASDSFSECGALSIFEVLISVYNYNENTRPLRDISQKIVKALHYEIFAGGSGLGYSAVRLYFTGRTPIMKDPDSDLNRVILQFDCRAVNGEVN